MKYLTIVLICFFCASCEKEPLPAIGLNNAYALSSAITNNLTQTSVTISYTVSGTINGPMMTERGVCIDTVALPSINSNRFAAGTGLGSYSVSITGLIPAKIYFSRPYLKFAQGSVMYGEEMSFLTKQVTLGAVTIKTVKGITRSSATVDCEAVSTGGGIIETRGICWGLTTAPTVSGNNSLNGSGTGEYSSNMTGLTAATTYYVRAFVKNQAGIAYSMSTTLKTSN